MEALDAIEKYIHGELNQDEIDLLWIEFLKDPDLFYYFKTLVHLHNLFKQGYQNEYYFIQQAGS